MFDIEWQVVLPEAKALIPNSVVEARIELYDAAGGSSCLVLGVKPEGSGFRWSIAHHPGGEGLCSYIDTGYHTTFTGAVNSARLSARPLVDLMKAAIAHDREVRAGRDK